MRCGSSGAIPSRTPSPCTIAVIGSGLSPERASLALRNLLRRFTDVCNAINYAHGRGILHRDLKPGNIILGKHGETLVVDWGLAKLVGRTELDAATDERTLVPSSASGSAETLPGSALGTPAYMSPEQARGDLDRLGPRSDVYSLGATLYCLLTGKRPFEGDDVGAVLRAVQNGAFSSPRTMDPSIDPALEAVCQKAMATMPEGRYATPRALADDIERWMADEPVSARREPFGERARRWMRRRRTAVTAAAAALIVATIGLASILAVQARANGQLKEANRQIQARFDLALEAIRTFHTGVSEDVLLENDNLKPVRDRLLRARPSSTSDYGTSSRARVIAVPSARWDRPTRRWRCWRARSARRSRRSRATGRRWRCAGTSRRGGRRRRGESGGRPHATRTGHSSAGNRADGRGSDFVRGRANAAGWPDPRPRHGRSIPVRPGACLHGHCLFAQADRKAR